MKSELNQTISALLRQYGPISVLKAIQEEAGQNEQLSNEAQAAMDNYLKKHKRQIDALQGAEYVKSYAPTKGKSRA